MLNERAWLLSTVKRHYTLVKVKVKLLTLTAPVEDRWSTGICNGPLTVSGCFDGELQ